MLLKDLLSVELLEQRIAEGYINVRRHNKFPLSIYCYSKTATFDYVWDEVTTKCRGLIVNDATGEIVASSHRRSNLTK